MKWHLEFSAATAAALVSAVIAGVGAIDAFRQDEAVLGWLFVVVVVLSVVQLSRRPAGTIRIRPDHDAWLHAVSAVTGEPLDVVADRAVGAYRELLGDVD